ncbi:MAG: M48 family metallopeptidase [Beijerinckiaceae bacterium]
MAAFGLYTHIQSNRRRSVILIVGLCLLILVVAFAANLAWEGFAGRGTLDAMIGRAFQNTIATSPVVIGGVLIWLAFAWKFHQSLIDRVTDGRIIERGEAPELYNLLENLCISRGMPMPSLRIVETDALNAFATGLNPKQYSIAVTRGLIDNLDRREVEAVLAHELTHIQNGDVRVMVIAGVIAGIVTFFGELIFRMIMDGPRFRMRRRSGDDGDGKGGPGAAMAAIAIAVLLVAAAWFLSLALRFALSRSREYLADAGAVELTKNPDAMISALMKISGRAEIPRVPSGVMEMCIENHKAGIADLFATHPPIEARIQALVTHAGGYASPEQEALPEMQGQGAAEAIANGAGRPSFTGDAAQGPWGTGTAQGPWGPKQS